MRVSMSTEYIDDRFGLEKTIQMIAEAGFTAFDLTLCQSCQKGGLFDCDDWREKAQHLREVADAAGIACNQAHAPFGSSFMDQARTVEQYGWIVRAIQVAAIVGADIIVVHPVQHLPYAQNAHILKEWNKQFYGKLIPIAKEAGIRIATENMWHVRQLYDAVDWNDNPITESTCSSPAEFCEYVDMMDSHWLTACLDIGHVPLIGGKIPPMIKALGKDRLQALHVHDNDWKRDLHVFPYTHRIDFGEVTTALREIGYEGDLTFEVNNAFVPLPDDLVFPAMQYLCAIGNSLKKQIVG